MSERPWGEVVKRSAVTAGLGAAVGAPLQAILMAAFWVHPWSVGLLDGYAYLHGAMLGASLGGLLLADEALRRVDALRSGFRRSLLLLGIALAAANAIQVQSEWLMARFTRSYLHAAEQALSGWIGLVRAMPMHVLVFALPLAFGLTIALRRRSAGGSLLGESVIAGSLTGLIAIGSVTAHDLNGIRQARESPGTWFDPWWVSLECHWTAQFAAFGIAFAILSPLLLALGRRWAPEPDPA